MTPNTPADWKYSRSGDRFYVHAPGNGYGGRVTIATGIVSEADASLIANAPDMKSTLELIAGSTEHADAAQQWEFLKTELLASLKELYEIRRFQWSETAKARFVMGQVLLPWPELKRAEAVISKNEVPA